MSIDRIIKPKSFVAIVGSGPSGMAAANALANCGVEVKVFDSGNELANRQHDCAEHLGVGVGGAGLFSDGKFSYFPSGTNLYHLEDRKCLEDSYNWCRAILGKIDIQSEPFPMDVSNEFSMRGGLKSYPAHYATLPQRKQLIDELRDPIVGDILSNATVQTIHKEGTEYSISYEASTGNVEWDNCSAVIMANGRFGGADLLQQLQAPSVPLSRQRYEIGIRIEAPSEIGFMNGLDQPDVKQIWNNEDAQIRTFCTCREGEVWRIPVGQYAALSGRSDGPASGFSNFGFLARFEGNNLHNGETVWEKILPHIGVECDTIYEPLLSFINKVDRAELPIVNPEDRPWFPKERFQHGTIADQLGSPAHKILVSAIEKLLEWAPDLADPRTMCIFPAIEGVGEYPVTDGSLKVPSENIWCCGDVVGRFRGLIPCIVSGYYAGLKAARHLQGQHSTTVFEKLSS